MEAMAARTTVRPLVLLEAATLLSGAGNGAALVLLPWIALEQTRLSSRRRRRARRRSDGDHQSQVHPGGW